MQSAQTIITDLRQIGEATDLRPFHWSDACRHGTPAYQQAVQFITGLAAKGERERAYRLAEFVAAALPHDIEPLVLVARLHFDAGEIEQAIARLALAGEVGERNASWIALRAACGFKARDEASAQKWARVYVDAVPGSFLSPKRTDLPLVGVVNSRPTYLDRPQLPKFVHFRGNYISQLAHREPVRYRFCSVFADSGNAGKMQSSSPRPDIVVNNVVVGELLGNGQVMSCVREALARWNRPAINAPEKAIGTARDKLYQSLKDFPEILAPKIIYLPFEKADETVVRKIESEFEYPVIVRSPFFQFGAQMYLARTRDQLIEHLRSLVPGCFVAQFVENQRRKGFYCKIRAIFVGNNLHVCRVDYREEWKVHSARLRNAIDGVEFYRQHKDMLEEEAAICKDPKRELGAKVIKALGQIRSVVKLDCFGVDFDVMKDGRLLLFEANASMNFIGNKRTTFVKHPEAAENAMIEDLYKMLDRRISVAARPA